MRKFKLLKQKTVFILTSALLLSGCGIGGEIQTFVSKSLDLLNGKAPDQNKVSLRQGYCKSGKTAETIKINKAIAIQEGSAPFTLSKVTGSIEIDSKGSLPSEFRLNLRTQMKDSRTQDSFIPDTSFTIKYQTVNKEGKIITKQITRSTGDEGYLEWQEIYPYKYVVQPFWIRLHREITKKSGPYTGRMTLPTAVNFWLRLREETSSFRPVMDLRRLHHQDDDVFKKYPVALQGLKCLTDKEHQPLLQLWATNNIGIQFSHNPSPDKTDKYESARGLINEHYEKPCTDDTTDKECFARGLDMELSIPLKVRTRRLDGSPQTIKINGGHYSITAQLLAEVPAGSGNYYRIHKESLFEKTANMSSSQGYGTQYLNPKFQLEIPYFNTNANHKLVLEIKETNGLPFRKFQGVYTIKNLDMNSLQSFTWDNQEITYNEIQDNSSLNDAITIIEDMNIEYIYTYAKKLAQKLKKEYKKTDEKTLIQRVLKDDLGFKKAHMSVSIETVRFANTKNDENCKSNEIIVKRRVEYVGKACLKDIFTEMKEANFKVYREDLKFNAKGVLVPNGEFELLVRVKEKDGYEEPLSTNQASCIAWRDTIDHKNFNRQIYFPRRMHFVSEKEDLYGTALIAVSPWHNQFQFFQDITQLHANRIRTKPRGVEHPRLVIPQFKSVNFYPSSIIDSFLNLYIKYNVRFLFQPIITRPDSLAWGKLPRSRELVRDGYYLTRVLIARSPQETGSLHREQTKKESDKKRVSVLNNNLKLDFHNLEYINHTDTIVKVEANYKNMSVPIEFNTQQLLYIGSRNVVILQMVPADPEGYEFKEIKGDGSCHLDTKKTEWKPYTDHDLVTFPFVGPFNAQNWINWNILQEACERDESGTIINCLETDKIIEQSEEGRKFRRFDMDLVMNASIEKDGGKTNTPQPPKPIATNKDTTKEPPSVITGVTGSNNCKSRHDNLLESELRRQSQNTDQQRHTDSEGTTITIGTEAGTDKEIAPLGSKECNDDENSLCNLIQREVENALLFGPTDDNQRTLENFWPAENEEPASDDVQLAGLGTEQCVNEEEVPSPPEKQEEVTFVSGPVPINDLLEDFAKTNALKILDLSDQDTVEKFLKDINSQDEWLNKIAEQMEIKKQEGLIFSSFSLLRELFETHGLLTKNREQFLSLWRQFDTKCNTDYVAYLTDSFKNNQPQKKSWSEVYQECAISLFRNHLDIKIAELEESQIKETGEEFIQAYQNMIDARKAIEKLSAPLPADSSSKDLSQKLIRLNARDTIIDPLFLERIISEGIENQDNILTNSFAHSLCGFWFNSFLKKPDYLEANQMQSAFNDYIRKLDYRMILGSDVPAEEAGRRDEFLLALFEMTPREGELSQCSESYRKCVLQDYCSAFSHDSSRPDSHECKKVSHLAQQDNSCKDLTLRYCKQNEENSLCLQTTNANFESEGQCKKTLKSHCEINPKDIVCFQYDDRCFVNYTSCAENNNASLIQAKEELINHWQSVEMQKKTSWFDSETPLQTCLRNPYEFFHFENKMVIGDISKVKYLSGLMQHFSINGSFSIGSYLTWGSGRKTGMGLKGGVGSKAGWFPIMHLLTKAEKGTGKVAQTVTKLFNKSEKAKEKLAATSLVLALDGDISIGIESGESKSVRRALDTRAANSVFLIASEANFDINVTQFKRCLVIKPRPNAFTAEYSREGLPVPYDEDLIWPKSFHGKDFKKIALARPGLMLCNPLRNKEDHPETIQESYYYIAQSNVRTDTTHLLNLYDIANRPFVIVLRGRKEFLKYSHMIRQVTEGQNTDTQEISSSNEAPVNMFIHYPYPVENMAGFSLAMRAFKDTGFYPGVYTYPSRLDDKLSTQFTREKGIGDMFFDFIRENVNRFEVPSMPSKPMAHEPVSRAH